MHLLTEILLGLIEGSEYCEWYVGTDRLSVPMGATSYILSSTASDNAYYVYIDEDEFRPGGFIPPIKYNIADPKFKPQKVADLIKRKAAAFMRKYRSDD